MFRKMLSIMSVGLICAGMAIPCSAQAAEVPQEIDEISVSAEANPIATRKVQYKTVFRNYHGRDQYRTWNITHGFWVEPDWIYL